MAHHTEIGAIVKPHGLKGHMVVMVKHGAEVFPRFENLFVQQMGALVPYLIEETDSLNKGRFKVKLAGIDSIGAAELLRGSAVFQLTEMLGLERQADLTGFSLYDTKGKEIGYIKEIVENPMQVLMLVKSEKKEFFVPLVEDYIISLDEKRSRIVIDIPEGLEDL